MTEFKVGNEVTLSTRGGARATVEYGPFEGEDVYVVKLVEPPVDPDEKRTFTALGRIMRLVTNFAVGDKVSTGRAEFTVEAGPFMGYGEWYAVRQSDGKVVSSAGLGVLTKVEAREIRVGDRVRVTDDDCGGRRFGGKIGTVKTVHRAGTPLPYLVEFGDGAGHHGDANGRWNCRAVELVNEAPADTFEYDGVTYDLTAEYQDRDGDVWRFAVVDGELRGDWGISRRTITEDSSGIAYAVSSYGPFHKI